MVAKASAVDEARGLLQKASEGDDEDAKTAKKLLKAFDEPSDDEKKKKEDEEKAAAAAKAADDEKKDADAKAMAANAVALASEVARLTAKDAARDLAAAKAQAAAELGVLFSKRPDLSEAQRELLGRIPLAEAKALVESWPRVSAEPGSAAAAQLAKGTGGEKKPAYVPNLSAAETALLAKLDAPTAEPTAAFTVGTTRFTPFVTPAQAKARLAELDKEGAV